MQQQLTTLLSTGGFSALSGGEAVDPLVRFGAGQLGEGLADAILQAGDAVLAPQLLGEGAQQVDLGLPSLLCRAALCGPSLIVVGGRGSFGRVAEVCTGVRTLLVPWLASGTA